MCHRLVGTPPQPWQVSINLPWLMPADWLSGQEAWNEEVHISTVRCEPSKACQQTPLQKRNPDHPESEPGSSYSRPQRWLEILALCVQCLPSYLSTRIFFFNLLVIDLGIGILNFARSLQINFASSLWWAWALHLRVSAQFLPPCLTRRASWLTEDQT